MQREGLGWTGWLTRLLAALFVVYATYNPEGYSYYHWVMSSVALPEAHNWYDANALKFLVGVLLLTAWVVFLNATRNSLGLLGITLILAICGGLLWLLSDLDWITPGNVQAFSHLVLSVVAIVLAVGMSWSHVSRRLSGQVDTDDVD